jgi:hypothetical protein
MHHCPLCDFSTDDLAAMFDHFSHRAFPRPAEHAWSSAATVAKALGLNYESGFRTIAGDYDLAGLKVTVHAARLGRGRNKSSQHRIYVECPTCRKSIPAGRMHQHLIVHGPRTRVCQHCGKGYGSGNHLRTHMRQAHGESRHGRFGVE